MAGEVRADRGINRAAGEQAEVHGEEIVTETGQGHLGSAHGTSGDIRGLQHDHAPTLLGQ